MFAPSKAHACSSLLRTSVYALLFVSSIAGQAAVQTSGNNAYGQGGAKARAQQAERGDRVLSKEELPPTTTSMFVDASVLINVKADEYVAVFGVAQDGATVAEAGEKMDGVLKTFTDGLKALHVRPADIFVDYIVQPKIYRYEVANNVAREKLAGFELKKNVSIHFTERDLIDKLVLAASNAGVYDLIKVDYIVRDTAAVQARVMAEAADVIKAKIARDEKLLGIHIQQPAEVYAERTAIHYPTTLYDNYTAAEAEQVSRPRNYNDLTIQSARRETTFFYNGLDGDGYDKVINPVLLEPMVQFTLYLKVKYDVAHAAEPCCSKASQ